MDVISAHKRIVELVSDGSFEISSYFKRRCDDRQIECELISDYITGGVLRSITEQSDGKYKLVYEYSESNRKDINIVVSLSKLKVRFVTVFPSYTQRRTKK